MKKKNKENSSNVSGWMIAGLGLASLLNSLTIRNINSYQEHMEEQIQSQNIVHETLLMAKEMKKLKDAHNALVDHVSNLTKIVLDDDKKLQQLEKK